MHRIIMIVLLAGHQAFGSDADHHATHACACMTTTLGRGRRNIDRRKRNRKNGNHKSRNPRGWMLSAGGVTPIPADHTRAMQMDYSPDPSIPLLMEALAVGRIPPDYWGTMHPNQFAAGTLRSAQQGLITTNEHSQAFLAAAGGCIDAQYGVDWWARYLAGKVEDVLPEYGLHYHAGFDVGRLNPIDRTITVQPVEDSSLEVVPRAARASMLIKAVADAMHLPAGLFSQEIATVDGEDIVKHCDLRDTKIEWTDDIRSWILADGLPDGPYRFSIPSVENPLEYVDSLQREEYGGDKDLVVSTVRKPYYMLLPQVMHLLDGDTIADRVDDLCSISLRYSHKDISDAHRAVLFANFCFLFGRLGMPMEGDARTLVDRFAAEVLRGVDKDRFDREVVQGMAPMVDSCCYLGLANQLPDNERASMVKKWLAQADGKGSAG